MIAFDLTPNIVWTEETAKAFHKACEDRAQIDHSAMTMFFELLDDGTLERALEHEVRAGTWEREDVASYLETVRELQRERRNLDHNILGLLAGRHREEES